MAICGVSARSKRVALLACACALTHGSLASAVVLADFQGDFAPSNWTTTTLGGASVNTTGAPSSISLTSNGLGGLVGYTISAPLTGTIAFDWSYSVSVPSFIPFALAPFGVLNNGVPTPVSSIAGPTSQSGSVSFPVSAGDVFGFAQASALFVSPTTTISNFSLTASTVSAIPEPGSMLALALLISGGALIRSRRSGPVDC